MLELCKAILSNQLTAALCALDAVIVRCPEQAWQAGPPGEAFCQIAWHAVFYTDLNLEGGEETFRQQPFHLANQELFRDYEELEDRVPQHRYERADVLRYVQHCRAKAEAVIAAETEETLAAHAGFSWMSFSRAELYLYTMRHLQDHAAGLSARLALPPEQQIPWIKSGWREL